jgi:hypothetical protein
MVQTDSSTRLDGYARRLLLIMAVSENKKIIDQDMADRCIQLVEWQRRVRDAYQLDRFVLFRNSI